MGAIARHLGLSEDTVVKLALDPDVPIYRPPGQKRWTASRRELATWLRSTAA